MRLVEQSKKNRPRAIGCAFLNTEYERNALHALGTTIHARNSQNARWDMHVCLTYILVLFLTDNGDNEVREWCD